MSLNIREIKRRQKSIGNIGQIARAMELVSVTKMRRSQRIALLSRPYAKAALTVLRNIKQKTDISKSFFFGGDKIDGAVNTVNNIKRTAILLITTDRGLCGGLNTNVFRKAEKLIMDLLKENDPVRNQKNQDFVVKPVEAINSVNNENSLNGLISNGVDFIVIGKKGEEWCKRRKLNIIKTFNNFGDYVDVFETQPVSEFLINIFKEKKYDKIFAVYTNFISALKQEAMSRMILPLAEKELQEIIDSIIPQSGKFSDEAKLNDAITDTELKWDFEYKFEPKAEEILNGILYSLVEAEIYYIILENNASEHSARRMAMRNAYDNSDEMLSNLNLTYNKARQAGITQELSEIAAGANT